MLIDHPRLRVLGAPLDQVFLMKFYAARDRDLDDLRVVWPLAGAASPQHAAEQSWVAYPHAPEDPYLANFIAAIARTRPRPRPPRGIPTTETKGIHPQTRPPSVGHDRVRVHHPRAAHRQRVVRGCCTKVVLGGARHSPTPMSQ